MAKYKVYMTAMRSPKEVQAHDAKVKRGVLMLVDSQGLCLYVYAKNEWSQVEKTSDA